jgi:hypothetical protein
VVSAGCGVPAGGGPLVAKATEIEFDAKKHFSQLAEDLGQDVALADMDRRASRYSRAFDGKYRSVAYTLACAKDGSTHQVAAPRPPRRRRYDDPHSIPSSPRRLTWAA